MNEKQSSFIIRLNWVDYLTLSSVATTWFSIMLSLNGMLHAAMGLLFLSMLADAFDGVLARKYGTERNFGRYLDGFMDVLIYLVSPSLILYLSGYDGFFSFFIMLLIAFGCIRLSVFNDIGNIEESDGLSYLGMPVFWSIPIVGVHQLLVIFAEPIVGHLLLSVALAIFCLCMIIRKPFFKFTSLVQILSITLGGFIVFLAIEFNFAIKGEATKVLTTALFLQWPIIVGGVLHMVVVSKDLFPALKIPVNVALFGANKTLRGFVVMPVVTILGFLTLLPLDQWLDNIGTGSILEERNIYVMGLVCGLLYVLAELPNSFLKRRMGAKPGETPDKFRSAFVFLDQVDSAFFISLGYGFFFGFHWTICLAAFVLSPVVALIVKGLLFRAKLKKTRT